MMKELSEQKFLVFQAMKFCQYAEMLLTEQGLWFDLQEVNFMAELVST